MTCLCLALVADTSLTVHLSLSLAYRSVEYTATTHTYKSQWSDPRLMSFIQGPEKSGHTVCKGRKAKRTSWILRATTLGFIYTLDVLLSKLPWSVSSK